MWATYINGDTAKDSPLKFTFLEHDQPGAREGGVGLQPGPHPSLHRLHRGLGSGRSDPAVRHVAAADYGGIPEAIRAGGMIDGKHYHVPFDIGFSSLIYRDDKIPLPREESWNILLDRHNAGRFSTSRTTVTIIKIGGAHQRGRADRPERAHAEQIQAAKETMIEAKPKILRNFWDNQNGHDQRLRQRQRLGHLHVARRLLQDQEPQEDEGRRRQVHVAEGGPPRLGLRVRAQLPSRAPGPRDAAVAAANTPEVAAWLTDDFQYTPPSRTASWS